MVAKRFTRTDPGTDSDASAENEPARATDRGVEVLLAISVIGVVASATEMAWLYHPGVNITRLYFGTDTHAQSILVGSVLACTLTLIQRHRGLGGMAPVATARGSRVALTVVGVAGLAGTIALTTTLSGTSPWPTGVGSCCRPCRPPPSSPGRCVWDTVPSPRCCRSVPWCGWAPSPTGPTCGTSPSPSSSTRPAPGSVGPALLAIRVLATFALAAASYYLVERPVMEGVFWRSLKAAGPALAAMGATVVVVIAATVAPAVAAAPINSVDTIPLGEQQALESASAFTSDPVRFLLVGDSLAVTAGLGLVRGSVTHFGVQVDNKGVLGCDLDDLDAISSGQEDIPVSACRHWKTLWSNEIESYHPDVVGLLAGRWDITDHLLGNTVVSIDQPAWNRHLQNEMEQVVAVLSARGAKVVLFTMPYIDPPEEAPNGSLYPENRNSRVDEYNQILERVAARHPDEVTVINLNKLLDPSGHFQTVVDGLTVRWADGIHITKAGGQWLEPFVLPTIAELGLEARASGRT